MEEVESGDGRVSNHLVGGVGDAGVSIRSGGGSDGRILGVSVSIDGPIIRGGAVGAGRGGCGG